MERDSGLIDVVVVVAKYTDIEVVPIGIVLVVDTNAVVFVVNVVLNKEVVSAVEEEGNVLVKPVVVFVEVFDIVDSKWGFVKVVASVDVERDGGLIDVVIVVAVIGIG